MPPGGDVVLWPDEPNPADVVLRPIEITHARRLEVTALGTASLATEAALARSLEASATAAVSVAVEIIRATGTVPPGRWVLPSIPVVEPHALYRLRFAVMATGVTAVHLDVDNSRRRARDDEEIILLLELLDV